MTNAQSSAEAKSFVLLSDISALLPLYVVCIFLSGWAFDDYYFRLFGLDPRFLDLGFHDTLVKGFTIIFAGASWLTVPYGALLLVTLFLSLIRWPPWVKFLFMAVLFTALLLSVYLISRSAGERAARIDKGDHSTLPDITFSLGKRALIGKLLFVKGDAYFVHRLRHLGDESGGELQLSVCKASEIQDVEITEHQ